MKKTYVGISLGCGPNTKVDPLLGPRPKPKTEVGIFLGGPTSDMSDSELIKFRF
jgi:hypothetical protein